MVTSSRAGGVAGCSPGGGVAVQGDRTADGVTVTRIGTQVVVRLSGHVGDLQAARLAAAVDEVAALVIQRVAVDLEDVESIDGAGLDFISTLHGRWQVKLLNTPAAVRRALPRQTGASGGTSGQGTPASGPITLPAP
jgi:anti-anti-sigma regulatory factor